VITVKLAGASWDWLDESTSWGTYDRGIEEDRLDKAARASVQAAVARRVGPKGWIHTAEMSEEHAESVWSILESIAGAGESMTAEERGEDAYKFRIMRRDANRIRESLTALGWTFVRQGPFTRAVAPGESA
jgi:hypothetical protein